MSEVISHKCPNCDGPLLFDPKTQKFHCEYCLSVFTEPEVEAYEKKLADLGQRNDSVTKPETTVVPPGPDAHSETDQPIPEDQPMDLFSCPSCGAEIVTDTTTAATYCYYCHNPVVLTGRVSGKFLPQSVLPFAIEKDEAVTQFLAWARKKKFIPKDFFNKDQVEMLTGIYFPYWVVDAKLSGSLRANANSVTVWRTGDYEYTQTKKYRVYREGNMTFKELVKNALQKNAKVKMVESVQPFPMEKAVPFKTQYLSGFQAEKRDLEFETLQQDIHNELKQYSSHLLQDTISGYTTVYNNQVNLDLDGETHQYVLLPVWLLTYRNDNGTDDAKKLYYFAMNGQSGKLSGKLPVDKTKLTLFSLGIGVAVFLLVLLGGYFI